MPLFTHSRRAFQASRKIVGLKKISFGGHQNAIECCSHYHYYNMGDHELFENCVRCQHTQILQFWQQNHQLWLFKICIRRCRYWFFLTHLVLICDMAVGLRLYVKMKFRPAEFLRLKRDGLRCWCYGKQYEHNNYNATFLHVCKCGKRLAMPDKRGEPILCVCACPFRSNPL